MERTQTKKAREPNVVLSKLRQSLVKLPEEDPKSSAFRSLGKVADRAGPR
jgi:hypothetical protein